LFQSALLSALKLEINLFELSFRRRADREFLALNLDV
jgi:hypothetical protein